MALTAGTQLGPFEIVAALGAGGMGEVYRARDTRLKRDVAIKVLPDTFAQDPDRLARFRREAELLASLNNPNIAAIYGLEQVDAVTALVLELVDGETLAEHIARGPVAAGEALPIVRQIADALEAAHEKGVIHRDLKPANIKITPDGTVKVLDFGLAKLATVESDAGPSGGLGALTMSPTISVHATYQGVILGTAAYMSPEQAKGRTVDKRTDVWAWGCVLFETLTGRRPFEAEDVADTIAFILTKEPDWSLLPADTPPAIRLLLRRCLEKDRKRRISDISTARFILDEPASVSPAGAAPVLATPSASRWRRLSAYAAVLVGAVLLTAIGAWTWTKPKERAPQTSRFTIVPPAPQVLNTNAPDRAIAISPDGSRILYRGGAGNGGGGQLFVRAIDQLEAKAIPLSVAGFRDPVFSDDGQWIAFTPRGELRKVSVTGGPSITLCKVGANARGMSWGPDNTIIFATDDPSSGLISVSAGGGEPKVLTKPDTAHGENDHLFPSFLPGGTTVLFTITASGQSETSVTALDFKTGQKKILIRGGSQAQYVDSGHLVYAASGSLRAVRFDLERLEVVGDPVPVVDQVLTTLGGEASFSISRSGTLLYVPGGVGGTGAQRSMVWVDRRGKEEAIKAPTRAYTYPRLSPDGTRVAIDIRDQDNDLWIWDLARETLTRLTFDPTTDGFPVWTPDSRRIIFSSQRGGGQNIYSQAADGTGAITRLTTNENTLAPSSISPDGTTVTLSQSSAGGGVGLFTLTLQGQPAAHPLIQTHFISRGADLSPDGRWIAYESNESGRYEIYVRPFPNVDSGGRWQVSAGGGARVAWARNGRELFYMNPADGSLMGVPVQTTGSTFSAGNARKVVDKAYFGNFSGNTGRTYDVSRDGQRFLMIKDQAGADQNTTPTTMVVALNWQEELKRLVPAR